MQTQQDLRCTIDAPSGNIVTTRLVRFSGWFSCDVAREAIAIELNGERQPHVRFGEREDVVEAGYPDAFGWKLVCDVATLCRDGRNTIHMEILAGDARLFHRNFRVELESRPRPSDLIFAMHIPKTAGTSLREALTPEFPSGMLEYYPDSQHSVRPPELARFSQTALDELDMVYGHFPCGIHQRITTRNVAYVAFVRRPFLHMQSMFFFKKHVLRREQYHGVDIYQALAARQDYDLDNCFTRYFANRLDDEAVGDRDLECAIANIERYFPFVGILDHVDASVDRLNTFLGTNIELTHVNRSPAIDERRCLDVARFRRAAKPRLELDLQLYYFILERFWGGSERVEPASVA